MKILLYTFQNRNNITYKIIRLKEFDKYERYFISGIEGTKQLVNKFIRNKCKFVIGFGDFNKRAKRIRIETKFRNKYGIRKIVNNAPEFYKSTLKLPVKSFTYRTNTTSNGPCNRSAFLLIHNAKIYNIDLRITFVHIPSSFNIVQAKRILLSWLTNLKGI